MFTYETGDNVRAIRLTEDAIGRQYVSFYNADKDKLKKTRRNYFIIGSIVLIACFLVPLVLSKSTLLTIIFGTLIFAVISFFTGLDGVSTADMFSKNTAMRKFEIDTKTYRIDCDTKYITVQSRIFAEYGTDGFWDKFLESNNAEIFQEATEIAVQEALLEEAIAGMKDYIKTTSESAIRDEVFHKIEEANDKYTALIHRFNALENKVLCASDIERDGKVLEHMKMIDELDVESA